MLKKYETVTVLTLTKRVANGETDIEYPIISVFKETDGKKINKLRDDIIEYERKNKCINNLYNYLSNIVSENVTERNEINNGIILTDFVTKWFGKYCLNNYDLMNFFAEYMLLCNYDIDSVFTDDPKEEYTRQTILDIKDRYPENIHFDTVIDWDKLKQVLISISRAYVKNELEFREFCLNNPYDESTYEKTPPHICSINAERHKKIIDKEWDEFYDGLKEYDKNILPTVNSYVDVLLGYFRNHPLSEYICTLPLFNPNMHDEFEDCIDTFELNEIEVIKNL